MGLHKGQCNNRKGRPHKPNKITTELKSWIQALIDNNRVQLEADLISLEPKERWQIIEKLMNYTVPKLSTIEANIEYDNLTDEHLTRITTDLLNTLKNDSTRKTNKN